MLEKIHRFYTQPDSYEIMVDTGNKFVFLDTGRLRLVDTAMLDKYLRTVCKYGIDKLTEKEKSEYNKLISKTIV